METELRGAQRSRCSATKAALKHSFYSDALGQTLSDDHCATERTSV